MLKKLASHLPLPVPRLVSGKLPGLLLILAAAFSGGGCATIRVTDPTHTATEQFLMSVAAERAIAQLSVDGLRDRLCYVDATYFNLQQSPPQELYLVADLRARLLREGARLTLNRQTAEVIVEIRSGAMGVDRYEYLVGIPAGVLSGGSAGGTAASASAGGIPVVTPDFTIIKNTKQQGYASVAIVAYRSADGSLLAQSGPFIGKTLRNDYWFLGFGPRTIGNIPTVEK